MNNYEWFKEQNLEEVGHELCELVDIEFDDCERCPVSKYCSLGTNGFIEWFKQKKDRDCDHCKYYKKGDNGIFSCSKWKCIVDEK